MADQDPVADLLRRQPMSDAMRAQAWDAYYGAANEDALTESIKAIKMPDQAKAALWDLKHSAAPKVVDKSGEQADLLALHGIKPQITGEETTGKEKLASALEPLAHPRTAGDIAALLIPSGGGEVIAKAVKPVADAVGKYGGAALEVGASFLPAKARAALSVLKDLSPTTWNSPLTVAGREGRAQAAIRKFNELPLAEQMKFLPETAAPVTTRTNIPIQQPQVPFSQRPLYEQMTQLPGTAAPERTRVSGPPLRDTPEAIAASAPPSAAKPAAATATDDTAAALRQAGFDPRKAVSVTEGAKRGAVSVSTGRTVRTAPPKTVAQATNEIARAIKQTGIEVTVPEHLAAANMIAKASQAGEEVAPLDALAAAKQFVQTYGTPSDATMLADVAAKNARTEKP